ncbi:MAG: CoA-binding protein [Rhodospirillales bacterium]|nr:CoA-binding protein [Rhodospirillales bacterium]
MTSEALSRIGDSALRAILGNARTIAMIGASPDPARDSHGVMAYLQQHGYRVIPVNPNATAPILGEEVHQSLKSIDTPVDIVDVFRRADAAGDAVSEAIAMQDPSRETTIWFQLGVVNMHAAARAREAGMSVVMDRCIKVDHRRLCVGNVADTNNST